MPQEPPPESSEHDEWEAAPPSRPPWRKRARRLWPLIAGLVLGVAATAPTVIALDRGSDAKQADTGGLGLLTEDQARPPVHQHADFALFIRGQRFDFGQPQFISVEGKELSPNVHIHDPRHTVVHVHRFGTTWDEFFRSLGFELTDPTFNATPEQTTLKLPSGVVLRASSTETFKFIVNGVRVDGISRLDISMLSRVLISFGSEDEAGLQAQWVQVTDEACIPQGVCQSRGNGAGEHGEPCATANGKCTGG